MEDFSKYLMRGKDSLTFSCGEKFVCRSYGEDHSSPLLEESVKYGDDISVFHDQEASHKSMDIWSVCIEEEIASLETSIETLLSEVRESDVKNALLSKNFQKNALFLRKIDEVVSQIEENYESQKKQSQVNKLLYFAHDLRFQDGVAYTETSCMRAVRELCEMISSDFSNEYFSDTVPVVCETEVEDLKQKIWSSVEALLQKHPATEIFKALSKNTRQSTENLNELCARIDLQRDAANLKLKFETGKLKDVSPGPALLKTVNELIEIGQVAHFRQFISCEASKNGAFDARRKLDSLNNEIVSLLKEKLDPSLAPIMQQYFHAEQECSSGKASHQYLLEELQRLTEEEKEKEEMKENIEAKYRSIQNFDKTVQRKQVAIQKLVQVNGSAKSRHRQQQSEIIQLVEEKILQKKAEICELFEGYCETLNEETDLFFKLPLLSLYSSGGESLERTLLSELTINSLKPHLHHTGCKPLNHELSRCNFPSYYAPEKLLPCIRDTHARNHQRSMEATGIQGRSEEVTDLFAKVDKVVEEAKKMYKQQFHCVVPEVRRSEERMAEVMSATLKFKSAVQTWWHQDGQFLVPWEKANGCNLQEYNKQFTKQGGLLKQLRDGNQKK